MKYNYTRSRCAWCCAIKEGGVVSAGRTVSGYCHECIQAFTPRHWMWMWVPELCFCCGWFGPGMFRHLGGWVICGKCHAGAIQSSKSIFVNDCL